MSGLKPHLCCWLSDGVFGKAKGDTSIILVSLLQISTSCTSTLAIGHNLIYPLLL